MVEIYQDHRIDSFFVSHEACVFGINQVQHIVADTLSC